ncbi:MAG: EthD domain-containing protein [Hyphomonadaceae bacterium]|nr:MAG: hypothetical protein FD160_2241 [Caulobacteraceae bacterium]MBT9446595.1 EthD domain-containing protein [Hyphomonadaceae bacterium]TPW02186.1 MAG: hypothetical protein FD124_3482 [Alphaproteobacteria bacterium]
MIKLTFCLTRRPEFTRESFQKYWRETHAPLVASVKDVLNIRRYVQCHSLPAETNAAFRAMRGGPEGYDGVAELWWRSYEDMAASANNPGAAEAGQMLLEDEKRFIDLSRSPLWWGEEHEIIGS